MSGTLNSIEDHYNNIHLHRESGGIVIFGTPTTLILDLDTPEMIDLYRKNIALLRSAALVESTEELPSKTVGHLHVIVSLTNPLDILTRIALQMGLGSDQTRGLFETLHVHNGLQPTVLFRPKE